MHELLIGLEAVFTFQGILAILIGVTLGIVVGVLPGLGPSLGVALLIPATFSLPASVSFNLLVSLYLAAEYGGSITAILIGTPGTAAATATVIDGYAMNQKGRGLLALQTSLAAATFGGVVGGIALLIFSRPLVSLALRFGPPEYFALGLFGVTLIASLSGDAMLKGLVIGVIGLLLDVIGVDPVSGWPRFTFGRPELFEGIPFLVVLIGVFAMAEVFSMIETRNETRRAEQVKGFKRLDARTFRVLLPTFARGSVIGTLVGALPGAGASIASWIAYDQEQRWSRRDEELGEFGKGSLPGVAAPEAAASASVGGALIPLLTLGIPGSPTTAVLVGALILHGLQPGPRLFAASPDLIYGLYVGLAVAYVVVYVLGTIAMPLWRRVLAIPNTILAPAIMTLSLVAAYSLRNLLFDVWITLGFGVLGFILKKLRFPMAPLVLAMVLGKMIESNYARSLIMSQGSNAIFFERPLSLVLIILALLALVWPLIQRELTRRRRAASDR
ncbi:MAG TPA: tripartite tricarboxylate transporter permease [Burkholderiales bacterium]|nr:tripartite tricarboxylate transporter permease [Burkholderiales bacterium]